LFTIVNQTALHPAKATSLSNRQNFLFSKPFKKNFLCQLFLFFNVFK
jgi:hypothetical protein